MIHAIQANGFGGTGVATATLLMLAATTVAFLRFDKTGRRTFVGWLRGLFMILGIWLAGPWFMMANATFSGGGFATASSARELMFLFVPGVAFIMATYDGTLGALLLITVLLPAICAMSSSRSRPTPHGTA